MTALQDSTTEFDHLRGGTHLGDLLVAALRRHADRTVLFLGDTELTGRQMADAVSRYQQAFESLGAGTGST
ncbi:MAG: acyl-CoA synthetase, partial [Actinomycetota bacterium]|nr:acyl-CoA synthetase [Actinomycetota bacterium]